MWPLGDDDVREINTLRTLALQPLATNLLLQGDVPFQRTLVKQVGVRLDERSKFTDSIFRIRYPGLARDLIRNLEIGSLAVEQLEKHPLGRFQPDEVVS